MTRSDSGPQLHDYVRLPLRAGACVDSLAERCADRPERRAGDEIGNLADDVNLSVLTRLREEPGLDGFLLAFVRGSIVMTRVETARTYWQRTVDCFGLERIVHDLGERHGHDAIGDLLGRIRRTITEKLTRSGDRLGPQKMVFRLARPDEKLLQPQHYQQISTFVDDVAKLADESDDITRSVFLDAHLGEARKSVARQLGYLLERFELERFGAQVTANLGVFARAMREAGCLHPALPVNRRAVEEAAALFEASDEVARRIVYLFRFAWLCRLDKAKDFSDFTLKALVVAPGSSSDAAAEAINARVFELLRATADDQPALQQFRRSYPGVRVSVSALHLALPERLYESFQLCDSIGAKLDFVTRCHMGGEYLRSAVSAVDPDLRDEERERLVHGISYRKTKTIKSGEVKRTRITPISPPPSEVRAELARALEGGEAESVERCARWFNEVAKHDLVEKIRGLWTDSASRA